MSAATKPQPAHLVWFKRDLRIHDHAPLWEAAQRGPVLPLYIIEPTIIHAADYDPSHYTFIQRSLTELREALAALGQPLIVRIGEAVPTLRALSRQLTIVHIWAHEETGNNLTYQRDIAVRAWATSAEIPLTELPPAGTVRRLQNRDNWAGIWQSRMKADLIPTPEALQPVTINPGRIPDHKQLKLQRDRRTSAQPGGETAAIAVLNDFLKERGNHYLSGLATPLDAPNFSSRLSPHIAYGTISLRRVVQSTRRRIWQAQREKSAEFDRTAWLRALKAFESRLHWRDHFIQKLEDEPAIEQHNYIRALDGLREPQFNQDYFDRWCKGQTGYPLIDAAMRSLNATGWLNFRMRAMLVSFASYDLWLHWQQPALHLARAFIDYEPGIHYSQMQMQSGTTGINTIRLYDPTKQALERDPNAKFIRKWVPELTAVPDLFVHEPWRMPPSTQSSIGCILGTDYPKPIVNHKIAGPAAMTRLHKARQRPDAVAQAQIVLQKHGSRAGRKRRSGNSNAPSNSPYQLEFGLGLDL